ncbi:MAG: peptidase S8, partial [Chloroflexota bacterium]|nr:peptidase S8 [Chloroflexota bacterium]
MRIFRKTSPIAAVLALLGLAASLVVPAAAGASTPPAIAYSGAKTSAHVCPGPTQPGTARCHALIRTDVGAKPNAAGGPAGYGPSDLQSAYALPSSTAGAGAMVAIVDAYDDPDAENDLAVYRSQYGLPPCTTANGCFQKVNQSGAASPLPNPSGSWSEEISLDLDMVSAVCPNCRILLVEANSNQLTDLGAAVNAAASLGARAISNSYGGSEFSSEANYESAYYNHPGLAVTASSGDSGYGV